MLDKSIFAPVVVIGFKRADLTRMCLDRLSRCRSLGSRLVRVYLDGLRGEADRIGTEQTQAAAESFKGVIEGLEIVRRNCNFGCRRNITEAISETLRQFDRVIVVEEDVCVSPSFLEYMDCALERFKDDHRIWCINSFVSPWMRIPRSYQKDVYLNRRNACWGWGVWKNRWQDVDFELKKWPIMRDNPEILESVLSAGRDIPEIAELQFSGKINTWAVACTLHMVRHGLYAVNPRYSISKNIGFGEGGLHCNSYDAIYAKQKYYDFSPNVSGSLAADNRILRQERYAGVICPWMLLRRLRRKVHTLLPTSSNEEPFVIPS